MSRHPSFRCTGVRIDALTLDEAAEQVAGGHAAGPVHLCNAYTLSLAGRDPQLRAVLDRAALNLPDGMPLVWIGRRLGLDHLRERVYGPDLMERCLTIGARLGARHALFGSTPEVLDRLTSEIAARWPDAELTIAVAPPVSDDPTAFDSALDEVLATDPTIVWVGLGTPKQDLVVDRFADLSRRRNGTVPSFVAIGAAFDFIAGTKRQAPSWMQRSGLEWLHRLATEPRRLWRRYLIGNTRFVRDVVRSRPELIPAPPGAPEQR